MIRASVHGRIAADPRKIATRTGKPMTVATIAVVVSDDRDGSSNEPLWLGIVAFGQQAEALERCVKGEPITAMGRVKRNSWTDNATGEVREQLQVIADAILTTRSARPGQRSQSNGRRQSQPRAQPDAPPGEPLPFNDDVPF